MYRVILAGTYPEASAYARDQGWRAGTYRIAARAATIKGLRVAEVHELQSFQSRLDRHAVLATLRHAKNLHHFLIADGWPPADEPVQSELPFSDAEQSDAVNRMLSDYDPVPSLVARGVIAEEAPPEEPPEQEAFLI